jgi:hypothetical protein
MARINRKIEVAKQENRAADVIAHLEEQKDALATNIICYVMDKADLDKEEADWETNEIFGIF